MCKLRFYEARLGPESFRLALTSNGWKPAPDFEKASQDMLDRLEKSIRGMMRKGLV